jgi:hypothetical protein
MISTMVQSSDALDVVPLGDDPVEELTASVELHDEVHRGLVLVGTLELHHARLAKEVVHDLHLAPHVLDVLLGRQLPLADGLARQLLPHRLVRAQRRHTELPPPQLLADAVRARHVIHGPPQHRVHGGMGLDGRRCRRRGHRGVAGTGGCRRRSGLLCPRTAVAHGRCQRQEGISRWPVGCAERGGREGREGMAGRECLASAWIVPFLFAQITETWACPRDGILFHKNIIKVIVFYDKIKLI